MGVYCVYVARVELSEMQLSVCVEALRREVMRLEVLLLQAGLAGDGVQRLAYEQALSATKSTLEVLS